MSVCHCLAQWGVGLTCNGNGSFGSVAKVPPGVGFNICAKVSGCVSSGMGD